MASAAENQTEISEPSPKIQKIHENGISEITPFLRVKRLSEKAIYPSRASPLSDGYDLFSAVETRVPAGGIVLVPTDLSIAVREGAYARIASLSGLALKHSIEVGAGVVDADYRGPVGVILFNHSDVDFEVKHGDRIAQMIIQKIIQKRLSEKAIFPSRGSPLSAGYDLSSAVKTRVPARGQVLVPTDLSIPVLEGAYARIAPRSGLALKHSIGVGAGVVDADYRGPVGVILVNHSYVDFEVKHGDRIAQLIIQQIVTPEVTKVDDLDSTVRGSSGFGSTGVSEITPFFRVKRLSEKAIFPSRGSPLSAGYDLSSAVETRVPARGKALVPTDLSIAVSEGAYARIASRYGLALKHSIHVVDADYSYRGPVGVILFNHSDVDFEVKHGDRIAQLIIEIIDTPEVTKVDDLDSTVRGSAGFGSTGV
ncbi:hypothetical protein ACS0TY_029396 [Phlomoides rotata]